MSRKGRVALAVVTVLLIIGVALRTPIRKALRPILDPKENWDGRFPNPEGLCTDSKGNLYVGDQDTGDFFMLDRAGKTLARFTTIDGYHDGQNRPSPFCRGLNMTAIEPRHIVAVAVHNVVEFTIDGDKAKLVRIIGSQGDKDGQMDGPEGLARDTNGDLYVTDEHNRRINIFDKSGAFLRRFPVPQDPQTVRVVGDRVYVALNKRNYLAAYSKDGAELFRIGTAALFPLFSWIAAIAAPLALAVLLILKRRKTAFVAAGAILLLAMLGSSIDYWHHDQPGQFRLPDFIAPSQDGKSLYITDRGNGRIQQVDLDGRLINCFGSYGKGPGQLRDPKDIVFDLDGNLIVADSGNHRLQVLTPEGKHLRSIE